MKKVAKVAINDATGHYLLLTLNNHPRFGDGADLPGGTVDEGESAIEAAIREVNEETGISISPSEMTEMYSGTKYSANGTHYALFGARVPNQSEITLSWEHSSYEWVSFDDFRTKAAAAPDTFMHMVAAEIRKTQA